jgi:release factor glutamine methyltransferase
MNHNIRTIKDIKPHLTRELIKIYPEPEINALATIIIRTLFGVSRLHAITQPQEPLSKKKVDEIIAICNELRSGKPLQYILGETSFYNCVIRVNPDVMIPRPETEELVDLIIKENRGYRGKILDAGCGSGCIAIVLAVNLPGTKVTGIDVSEGAIRISQENALLNNAVVTFLPGDILNPAFKSPGSTGIIVSNPPYILESEKAHIAKNVLDFEPHRALFVPDSDPFLYYRAILKIAEMVLIPRGKVYFEINEAMGPPITELLKSTGFSSVEVIRDINGKDRIVKGIKSQDG